MNKAEILLLLQQIFKNLDPRTIKSVEQVGSIIRVKLSNEKNFTIVVLEEWP